MQTFEVTFESVEENYNRGTETFVAEDIHVAMDMITERIKVRDAENEAKARKECDAHKEPEWETLRIKEIGFTRSQKIHFQSQSFDKLCEKLFDTDTKIVYS